MSRAQETASVSVTFSLLKKSSNKLNCIVEQFYYRSSLDALKLWNDDRDRKMKINLLDRIFDNMRLSSGRCSHSNRSIEAICKYLKNSSFRKEKNYVRKIFKIFLLYLLFQLYSSLRNRSF